MGYPVEVMTPEQFREFVAAQAWTFAKTMPHIPHYWLARKDVDGAAFEAAVRCIRTHGEPRPWGKRPPLTYLDCDGWTYWTMGAPIGETTIINRKVQGTSLHPAKPSPKDLQP